jgi:hypothetical protein
MDKQLVSFIMNGLGDLDLALILLNEDVNAATSKSEIR